MLKTISLTIVITLMYSAPLIFAGIGGVLTERSGVINIGIEGMMAFGAFVGAAVGYYAQNPWIAFLAAGCAGGLLALIHAIACVSFRANQTISGVALNFIGSGLAIFMSRMLFNGATMTVPVPKKLPKIFGGIEFTFIMALAIAFLLWFIMYKTKWGLRLIAVGEHPAAADTLKVNVYMVRYISVILSGVLAGFGGASLTLSVVSNFSPTVVSGQGFIALAAVIFGKWTPHGCVASCVLFGFAQALVVMLGGEGSFIPSQILAMLPYVLTILMLIIFDGRSTAPKASGVPYQKGVR